MLVVSASTGVLDLDLGLEVRAEEIGEDEAQVRGRPMLIKKRRSRVEFFMLRKSASGAGEPVGRVAQPFIAHGEQTIVLIGANIFGHVLNVHWLTRSSVQRAQSPMFTKCLAVNIPKRTILQSQ